MTARSSPHHAAVVRARVRRRGDKHKANRATLRKLQALQWELEAYRRREDNMRLYLQSYPPPGSALRDEPKTEAQKASRWRKIWGAR